MHFTSFFGWSAFLSSLIYLSLGGEQQHTVPLKVYKFNHHYPIRERSNASGKKTVLLKSGDSLKIPLCVRQDGFYKIAAVRYSNDGAEDVISLSINSEKIGSFISKAETKYGLLWNRFNKSEPIGELRNFKIGSYSLEIYVESADYYGIEIDTILLETTDLTVSEEILECALSCLHHHSSDTHASKDVSSVAPMEIVQRSFKTRCAEQDNIDVPIFHESINSYEIVATYPKYNSSYNTRHAIFENCEELSPELLWRLKMQPFDLAQKVETDLDSFELNLRKEEPFTININFILKGKAEGLIDSDIGSVLKIDFQNVTNDFNVSCRYVTREGRISAPAQNVVTKVKQTFNCTIPDYTWTEHENNTIQLIMISPLDESVKIQNMELWRRKEKGQTNKIIHKDTDIIIEGRNVDFWWRRPQTMSVKTRSKTVEDIDFIIVYKRVPSTGRFNQVLVIYQDGNVRILPLPPKGVDWTPFGSSIIIGQSDTPSFRPVAEISAIEIISTETDTIQLHLYYLDGGFANIRINIANLKTVVRVSQLRFKRSLKNHPFARFRSMWVIDGNCDVDHLKVNGGQNTGILGPWSNLRGNVVEFYRLCESMHLNLSPDIMLKVLN